MGGRNEDVKRIRELESEGASFSRNSDYAFYQEPSNGRARRLRRFLRELAVEIATHRGSVTVICDRDTTSDILGDRPTTSDRHTTCDRQRDGARYRLVMIAPTPGYRRTIMLDREELEYLKGLVPTLAD